MSMQLWSVNTPVGPWTVIAEDGVVLVSSFESAEATVQRLPEGTEPPARVDDLGAVSDAVLAYLDGRSDALDEIPVSQPGGAYRQEVWRVMREIPAGETWSYTELAAKAGNPAAARAAASACATNRVAPFVPFHRVVRSDGSLGGYYYGLPTKSWLLAHERHEDEQLVL